ncbi:hypothetical protein [Halorarum salinum]|uniref:Uncharacterized protein n=1 Tax=Halorarum salinum TaxID=2743089 RepID=A0A7D5QAR1_9EURY|nr:hypothetical protein [Halobaculum salinum]QLG61978.1 hypothetical protein HUG12_09695 [Halobaculum salinum]
MVFDLLDQVDDVVWTWLLHLSAFLAGIHLVLVGMEYLTQPAQSLLGEQLAGIGLHASGLALSLEGAVTIFVLLVGTLLTLIGLGFLLYVGKQVFEQYMA